MTDSRPGRTEIVGVVLVAAFVVFATLVGLDARTGGRRVVVGEAAARSFVEAWRGSLEATYSANTVFTRENLDGAELRSEGRRVQRPPDELIVGLSDSELRRDGESYRCAGDPAEGARCVGPTAAAPFEQRVDTEVATLESYLTGNPPLYEVREVARKHCYELEQARPARLAPYGNRATFCFDKGTGAMTRAEVLYDNGVIERTVVSDLTAEVNEAELDLRTN